MHFKKGLNLSVGHSATIFRKKHIRQKTIRQKRHSATLPYGKTIRQKIFGNWKIGNRLFGNQIFRNLDPAKKCLEICYSAKYDFAKVLWK